VCGPASQALPLLPRDAGGSKLHGQEGSEMEKLRETKSGIGKENALVNPEAIRCVDVAELPCSYAC